jgi:hypothetical protein
MKTKGGTQTLKYWIGLELPLAKMEEVILNSFQISQLMFRNSKTETMKSGDLSED